MGVDHNRLAPFANSELGAKAEEMPCGKEGGENSAVRVLERDDKRGGGEGFVERRLPDPGRELCHSEAAIGGVVTQERLMALLAGMSL